VKEKGEPYKTHLLQLVPIWIIAAPIWFGLMTGPFQFASTYWLPLASVTLYQTRLEVTLPVLRM